MVLGLHLSPLWTSPQMVLGVARYSGVGVTPRHHTTHTPKPPPNFLYPSPESLRTNSYPMALRITGSKIP